jgi:hypothetical protein
MLLVHLVNLLAEVFNNYSSAMFLSGSHIHTAPTSWLKMATFRLPRIYGHDDLSDPSILESVYTSFGDAFSPYLWFGFARWATAFIIGLRLKQ